MSAEQNIATAKKGYSAYSAGDAETAMSFFDDDIEWITPGNSSVSGTFHGKAEVGAMWMKLAEKSTTTTPERFLGDDEVVVVLTRVTAGGESADDADVLTFRDGKVVKFQSAGDTAMLERVFGTEVAPSGARFSAPSTPKLHVETRSRCRSSVGVRR